MSWEATSLWGGVSAQSQKAGQSRDLEVGEQRRLHFSAHRQLTDCGPNQTLGLRELETSPQKPCGTESGAQGAKRSMAYKPL